MTVKRNRTLHIEDYSHEAYGRGANEGECCVILTLGGGTEMTVDSFQSQISSYNWQVKVNGGIAPMVVRAVEGEDVLDEEIRDQVVDMLGIINPMMSVVETSRREIPSAELARLVEYWSVTVPYDDLESGETYQHFPQKARGGDAEFVIETSEKIDPDVIEEFSNDLMLPDERVYLYPTGENLQQAWEEAETAAKRNRWKISTDARRFFENHD